MAETQTDDNILIGDPVARSMYEPLSDELEALRMIREALMPFDMNARTRMLGYTVEWFRDKARKEQHEDQPE